MDREKQVGLLLVGHRGAAFQRDERVVGARVNHFGVHAFFDQFADAQGDIEHQFLFDQAVRTLRALVVPAMAGIDHDAPDLQSQRAGQRTAAGRGAPGGLAEFPGRRRRRRGGWRGPSGCVRTAALDFALDARGAAVGSMGSAGNAAGRL